MYLLFSDDKPVQEEDWVVCQHPECPERRRASKVRTLTPEQRTECGLILINNSHQVDIQVMEMSLITFEIFLQIM